MEFATGAMSSLIPKLGELLLEEYDLQKGLKKGIKDLRDELLIIEAALEKVSDVPLDQLDPVVKIWANDVRDLSYAIEDSLDSFMVRVEGLEPEKPHTFLGFIKKTCKKVNKLKIRREIANDIKDVKIQVQEVKERYDRYKDIIGNTSAPTKVDPRLLVLYSNVSNLVGIDEAISELTKRLSPSTDVSQENIKIISVVGFGGLGKTTLAKALYDGIKKRFDCASFLSVGRNPDKKKVIRDILYELDKKKFNYITESKKDERQLIDQMREFLADKRYILVIDDIWDISTWELIKCALVDSNSGSRIITTTRVHEVAKIIGGVYNMKPLSNYNSKKLFRSRVLGSEGRSPDDHSDKLFNRIVRKCGGVPLSIITLASLLVSKPRDDWSKVFESIGFGNEDNEVVQNTRKIISFSYYDLPFHLRTCLLHLSAYPEDYWIAKKTLIWMWVAEGFIPIKQRIGPYELGQSYYNDLINRSMLKADDPDSTMEDGVRVHDIVHDLIRSLARELNFVTLQDMAQYNTCSPSTSRSARRLAIHGDSVEHMDVEHVRSAFLFDDGILPPLSSFKVLRVLVLHDCDFAVGGCCFEHLGKLVQLRYLGLINTPITELPTDIGHDLKFLQTLITFDSGIGELPLSVGELTNLLCLCASEDTRMMARIGKLTSLEELELNHVDKSPDFVKELGMVTQLRVLKISFDEMDESMHKDLLKSVYNLHKIQTLEIMTELDESIEVDGWEEWAPCSELRQFRLSDMILPRCPTWINPSRVPHVSYIWLEVGLIKVRDMKILGRLLSLHFLYLSCLDDDALSYTIGSHEFQNIKILNISVEILCGVAALPMLEELECEVCVGTNVGLKGNMPLLKKVTYKLNCYGHSEKQIERAMGWLRHAAETHPNRPKLKIDKYDGESDSDSDSDSDDDDDNDDDRSEDEELQYAEDEDVGSAKEWDDGDDESSLNLLFLSP